MFKYVLGGAILFATSLPLLAAEPGKTMDTSAGKAYVDEKGMTLYTFDKDAGDKSMCNGPCAENWPPLFAADNAKSTPDMTVITRDDGKSWTVLNANNYWSVAFASPDAGWAVGANGRITKLAGF